MSLREDLYRRLAYIALREFPDVVVGTEIVEGKLRIFIADKCWYVTYTDLENKLTQHKIGNQGYYSPIHTNSVGS